MALCY